MSGIYEFQMAVVIQNAEKHRCVARDLDVLAEKVIDMIEDPRGFDADPHPGERALKHGRKERGTEALAGNIGNEECRSIVVQWKNVKVIASDR